MIYQAPSWLVSCKACGWESKHWSQDQAMTMKKVHQNYNCRAVEGGEGPRVSQIKGGWQQ